MNVKMPCQHYLVRRANNEDELNEFAHFYIKTREKNSDSLADAPEETRSAILLEYVALVKSGRIGKTSLPALSYKGKLYPSYEFGELIVNDSSIETARTCMKYLSKKAPDLLTCCKRCMYGGAGSCANMTAEFQVLRFISSSESNLDAFIEAGGTAAFFKSVIDLAIEKNEDAPVIAPVARYAFEKIVAKRDVFFSKGASEEAKFARIKVAVISSIREQFQSPPELLKNNSSLSIIWDNICSMILRADEVDLQDVLLMVAKFSEKTDKKSEKKTEKSASKTKDSSKKIEKTTTTPPEKVEIVEEKNEEIPSKNDSTKTEIDEKNAVDIVEDAVISDKNNEDAGEVKQEDVADVQENNTDKDRPSDEIMTESDDVSDEKSEEDVTSDEEVSPEKEAPAEVVSQEEEASVDEKNAEILATEQEAEVPADVENAEKNVDNNNDITQETAPDRLEEDIIFLPKIDALSMMKIKDFSQKEDVIFSEAALGNIISIEVVLDEDGAYRMFVYSPALRSIVKADPKDMPDALVLLLRKKSVIKLCWQPYYLYSVCRANGIIVENVYSIFTVDRLLNPQALPCAYPDLIRYYSFVLKGEIIPKQTFENDAEALMAIMPLYKDVYQVQTREPRLEKKQFEEVSAFDQVLGLSFLRGVNFHDEGCMFEMHANGEIVYKPFLDLVVKKPGYLVSYAINMVDVPGYSVHTLYKNALCYLARKGRFKKTNIQLLAITDKALYMFVGFKVYEYITTQLQNYFNKWAVRHDVERFSLVSDHRAILSSKDGQHHLPADKDIENKMLKTMGQIMNRNTYVEAKPQRARGMLKLRDRSRKIKEKVIPFTKG